MGYSLIIPVLTGNYEKDKKLIEDYMKQVNSVLRNLEAKIKQKENDINGNN